MIDRGADVHARDEEGDTILMRAVSGCASLPEVEELLGLGVDANLRNDAGESALDLAETLGLEKIVGRLKALAD